jgi:hypothetical protein
MNPPDIYFSGTGMSFMFSFGVAKYLAEHYNAQNYNVLSVSGGGGPAVAFLTLQASQFDEIARRGIELMAPLSKDPFAIFRVGTLYQQGLEMVVTHETLPLLHNRLQIATTTFPLMRRKTHTTYSTPEEVIQTLRASSYIPGFFFRPPYKTRLLEFDGTMSRSPVNLDTALRIGIKAGPNVDIYLTEDRHNYLKFPTFDEAMLLYNTGYQRASEFADVIQAKLHR